MRGWFFATRPAGDGIGIEEEEKGKEIVGERFFLSFKMNMYVYASGDVLGYTL